MIETIHAALTHRCPYGGECRFKTSDERCLATRGFVTLLGVAGALGVALVVVALLHVVAP